jgi:hypothetical protein
MILKIQNIGLGGMALGWILAATAAGGAAVSPYRVPKQPASTSAAPASPMAAPTGQPAVSYKVPPDWEEVPPGSIRIASFKVKGPGTSLADVGIVPLAGTAGSDLENVNRWRQQVGLGPISATELAGLGQKVAISGENAQLYDLTGQPAGGAGKVRILAAIQRLEGGVFFYKMTGNDELVAKQKPNFVEFLKSVKFQAQTGVPEGLPPSHPPIADLQNLQQGLPASHPPIGPTPGQATPGQPALPAAHPPIGEMGGGAPAASGKSVWKVPAGWEEQAPGMMQTARFVAAGAGGAKAEASVASIPGEGGGLLGNANRWRKQIGLDPIDATELAKQTSTLEAGGAKATVLDVTSQDKKKRLIAVTVPGSGSTTFYKLMGDETVVAKEKEAFLRFVQSPQ